MSLSRRYSLAWFLPCVLILISPATASAELSRSEFIRANYFKTEVMIPMRDGVKLHTSIYAPNETILGEKFPMLMTRTPYSCAPYGVDQYSGSLGPTEKFEKEKFIFVKQDVRGKYLSEGTFINMRPHLENKTPEQFDESTDTYDTVEWLISNVAGNNGRVGQWGISYPGFYTSAGVIDSHPALVAVSPQAPIADWYFDDFHRNGAFVLPMAFNFFSSFGVPRPEPSVLGGKRFDHPTRDGYEFFLQLGPMRNVNDRYFKGEIPFWNDIAAHPDYDEFWQSRNLLPHLKNVRAAVLVVGGWYDTEDLYGPLRTYAEIERNNPDAKNSLVMGPWFHGQWAGSDGSKLGEASFQFNTVTFYQEKIVFPFFDKHLKGDGDVELPEAFVFQTGANQWKAYENWPPAQATSDALVMTPGKLVFAGDAESLPEAEIDYISDPSKPVPYTQEVTTRWARDYVTEDQRFAARRPDVVVFRSDVLDADVTIAGPLTASIQFSTTGTSADLFVKLIDEHPGRPVDSRADDPIPSSYPSHEQQLVRVGMIRTRYRDGFESPKPLTAGEVTPIDVPLRDINHTFKRGHRIMVQVQSTFFPFVDRNPQTYVKSIFDAVDEDFQTATHTIHTGGATQSVIKFSRLK